MADHLYKIGQTVSIVAGIGSRAGVTKIVRLMPADREDLDPQYRVKGASETHERVVAESEIKSLD